MEEKDVEKSNYHFHRHNLNASVDESDVFKQAHLKRKLLAQNFYASLSLSSNATTCYLLGEDLTSYSAFVDSRTNRGVNIYADVAFSLASHCKNESKEWRSNLKSYKGEISNTLSEMKCGNCADWKPSENFLRMLSQSSNSSGTTASLPTSQKLLEKPSFPSSELPKLTVPKDNVSSSHLPMGKITSASDIFGTSFKKSENIEGLDLDLPSDFNVFGRNSPAPTMQAQPNFRSDFKGSKITSSTSADISKYFNKRPIPGSSTSTVLDPGSCWSTPEPATLRNESANFGKELTGTENFFGTDGSNNNSSGRLGREFDKQASRGRFGSSHGRDALHPGSRKVADERQKYYQADTGTSSSASNFFKTARDELVEQNAKKNSGRDGGYSGGYGRGSYNDDNSYNNNNNNSGQSRGSFQYGGQKRSLGTARRAGVLNKFVPPVRPSEEDECNGPRQGRRDHKEAANDGELDDRLKNIDQKMIELIKNEIMDISAPVSWDDIAGLDFAKSTIQEIVVWPMLRPDIFTGLRKPPKGLLLFGPPGTGKTLIGKCIASQSQSTFFSISASSLTSKWIGDGEKMVRALFAVAKCHQPAVVFIDEIDSLLTQRSDTEHESSRRIKTEFLVQLDGAGTGDEERILVVGATNRPQELDEAARRRLVKRLYIPLPEFEARRQIVERLMSTEKSALSPEEICEIARLTDGYSGADMKNLCQEASLGPIRSLSFAAMHQITADEVRPVSFEDFRTALNRVRASVSKKDLDQYVAWDQTYGMSGASF